MDQRVGIKTGARNVPLFERNCMESLVFKLMYLASPYISDQSGISYTLPSLTELRRYICEHGPIDEECISGGKNLQSMLLGCSSTLRTFIVTFMTGNISTEWVRSFPTGNIPTEWSIYDTQQAIRLSTLQKQCCLFTKKKTLHHTPLLFFFFNFAFLVVCPTQ